MNPMLRPPRAVLALILGIAVFLLGRPQTFAQERIREAPAQPASKRSPSGGAGKETSRGKPDKKKPEKKPEKKDGREEDKDGESADSDVVERPSEPPETAGENQFEIRPDEDGKVRFSFVGAPWPDLLRWLADISGKSLDWQELPDDYLNLVTQRTYTIQEAQDVINRHLLARGFTLLTTPETLTVVKIDELNPALVPRVEPDELADRMPHEFVKVSFELEWLPAETAVEEMKPMISPNGKLTALKATNRLEAMDAAINLRQIHQVLQREQSSGGRNRLVRVFKLEYTRAAEVLEQLKGILGLESKQPTLPTDPRQLARFRRQIQQMAQKLKGKEAPSAGGSEGEVHLVVNSRENSILAHAPPEKMAVIAQAIEAIDVEPERPSLLRNLEGVRVYRLESLEPETLVRMLEKTGDLSPNSRLEIDEKNKAVIAYGTAVDHVTIRSLVERLDGSNRRFEVIPLRKLEADYVAGTIQRMLGGEQEQRVQARYIYDYYAGDRESEKSADQFRVDADVEYNRLLLWANDIEMEQVRNLLVKLGEIPPEGGNPRTLRVIESTPGDEATDRMLKRLRRLWPSIAPNELILPSDGESGEGQPPSGGESSTDAEPPREKKPSASRETSVFDRPAVTVSLAGQTRRAPMPPGTPETTTGSPPGRDARERRQQAPAGEDEPGAQPPPDRSAQPPVRITRRPDGRLVVASQDTRALDRLEELLQQLAPPRRGYKIFHLEYPTTWAWGVAYNLEEFFKEEEEDSSGSGRFSPFYYSARSQQDDSDSLGRLSDRRPLKFIPDADSRTILVQGATPEQLKTIEELIDIYDRPPDTDSKSVRKTEIFHIQYSKAQVIAQALKDVYRDLLSARDPALANQNRKKDEQGTQQAQRSYTYVFGGGDNNEPEPEERITFKGLLSIGVDEESNILIVSAPERLLENIRPIVEELDQAARPPDTVVRVAPTNGNGVNASVLQALVHHARTGRPEEQQTAREQKRTPRRERQPDDRRRRRPNRRRSVGSNGDTTTTGGRR